jgi:hypothetical protein
MATVYYVDLSNGDNNWDGQTTNFTTATGPFATIDYASAQLTAGDTCWIRFTTYPETVDGFANSGTSENRIYLYGDTNGTNWADSTDYPIIDMDFTRTYGVNLDKDYYHVDD